MLKSVLKKIINIIAYIIAYYYILIYKLLKLNFKDVSIMISKWSGKFGILIRRHYYKNTLEKCGEGLNVHYGAFIVYPNVIIGNRCTIEEYSIVSISTIGNDVILAARVSIMSGGHHHDIDDLGTKFYDAKSFAKRVFLGDNLWIGTHAVIMNDVSSDTVVGASSVVTKKFPVASVIMGIPAKLSRIRGEKSYD